MQSLKQLKQDQVLEVNRYKEAIFLVVLWRKSAPGTPLVTPSIPHMGYNELAYMTLIWRLWRRSDTDLMVLSQW